MDCASIRDAMRASSVPTGPEVEAHIAACPACRTLVGWEGAAADMPLPDTPEGDLDFAALERVIAAEQGFGARVQQLPTSTRRRLAFATAIATVVLVVLAKPRVDLSIYPGLRLTLELVVLALLLAVVALEALRPLHRPAQSGRTLLVAGALGLFLPFVLAALPPAHLGHAQSLTGVGSDFWPRASACFCFGVLVAVPTLGLVWLASRVRPLSLRVAFAIALAAGLTGDLALQLHCPITLSPHLLAGHATVPLVLAAVLGLWTRLAPRR